MNIFITGSTGFIGRSFVKRLLAENKHYNIFCGVRSSSKKEDLEKLNIILVNFDLNDFQTFENALEGMDIVVHFAAHYNFHARKDILFSQNVEATKKLAEVCLKKEITHFVYCSTTEVVGPAVNAIEDAEYHPDYAYGESKMEAEKILLKMHKEYGFPLTIARPTGVIGPGECYPFNDIIIAIDKGLALLPTFVPGAGKGTIHWTYIDDIIQGFLRIIENPEKSIGQIYNLASDNPQTWNDLIETICESLGKTRRIFHIPAIIGRIGLALFTLYYKIRGVDNFVLRAGTVKAMQTSRSYSNAKIKKELGFKPSTEFKKGINDSVLWLRKQGRLKSK